MKTRKSRCLFLFAALTLAGKIAIAQTISGTPPYSTISGGPVDEINLANLNVHFKFPVFHKPGRGLPFNMDATYDTTIWYPAYSSGYGSYWSLAPTQGWTESSMNVGSLYAYEDFYNGVVYYCNFVYYDGFGTGHSFPGPSDPYGNPCPANSTSTGNVPSSSVDGSGYVLSLSNFAGANFTAQLNSRDGNYIVPPVETQVGPGYVEDRNGNVVSFDGSSTYTDTLGQPAITLGTTTNATTYTYTNSNGAPSTVKMAVLTYTQQSNFGCSGIGEYYWPKTNNPPNTLMDRITLPNSTFYQFSYEPTPGGVSGAVTGRLASITLPTGGTISYTYTGINCKDGTTMKLTRHTPDGTWTYTRTLGTGAASTTTVTDPQGNQTVLQFQGIYETQRQIYQAGALLQTTNTCYNGSSSPCTGTSITLPITQKAVTVQIGSSGPQSEQIYKLATDGSGVILEEDDYDIGPTAPGPLLKKTLYTYASLGPIKSFPQTIIVQDGSNHQVAKTTYNYDEPGLVSTSGNNPPVPQRGVVINPRGNLTSVQRWLNTTGGNVTSSTVYYDTGVPYTTTDPNHAGTGNPTTTYSYSSAFGYAYPTQVVNALGQITTNNYDINTGLLISTKDANNQTTSSTFDDMLRPTQTNYADSGQTGICYTDEGGTCTKSGPPFSVVTTQKVTSSINLVETTVTDLMGRIKQSQLNSDPEGITYIDSTYDSLGRLYTLSNPHRSSSSPTDGTTTYKYDPLGRITEVDRPDGLKITSTYVGNCTTVTDEVGKARKSCLDGLGRATSVFEDPAGLNYETDNQYDPLGNLIQIQQKGGSTNSSLWRTRTFGYDSLSRLACSSNPEVQIATCPNPDTGSYTTGTVRLSYDANGNMLSKIGPAQNQTGTLTVTSTYCYDALNRLTAKAYTSQTCANGSLQSPMATYSYDQSLYNGLAITNGVGRRTGMTDPAGSEAWSYDVMGRVLKDQRTADVLVKNVPSSKTTFYTYNLDGSIASLTYPAGWTLAYTPSAAARPVTATDTTANVTFAASALYTPPVALRSLTNGTNILSTWYYNNDLQLCRFAVNSSGTAPSSCGDTSNSGNVLDLTYNFNLGTADNGNVAGIANNKDTTRSQTFVYDSLNRLSTAQTSSTYATSPAHCWGESFGIDPWGNLQTISGVSSSYNGCTQDNLSTSINAKNHILDQNGNDTLYDAAGNFIIPATSYLYTYNAENQMTQASTTSTAGYVYDGNGRRMAKMSGGAPYKIYWYGMGTEALDESDGTGNITDEYIFFNGKRIAHRVGP